MYIHRDSKEYYTNIYTHIYVMCICVYLHIYERKVTEISLVGWRVTGDKGLGKTFMRK